MRKLKIVNNFQKYFELVSSPFLGVLENLTVVQQLKKYLLKRI